MCRNRWLRMICSLALILAMGVFAPPSVRSDEKPLVIAFRGDAATMDPHGRAESTTMAIQSHIYEHLVSFDLDLKIVPQLAERFSPIDDLTWEFKLKKGIVFQNGEPFDAASAVYSLERAKTWKKSQFKRYVPDYTALTVVDSHTFHIGTKNPEPELPLMLTDISMVPPRFFKEHDEAFLSKNACGTGPYKLLEWIKDDHMTLAADQNWHGGTVDFQKVIIRPIPNDATRVAALISGEIDVCWAVSIPDIPESKKRQTPTSVAVPAIGSST